MAVAFAGEMGLSVWIGMADILEGQRFMKGIDLNNWTSYLCSGKGTGTSTLIQGYVIWHARRVW